MLYLIIAYLLGSIVTSMIWKAYVKDVYENPAAGTLKVAGDEDGNYLFLDLKSEDIFINKKAKVISLVVDYVDNTHE